MAILAIAQVAADASFMATASVTLLNSYMAAARTAIAAADYATADTNLLNAKSVLVELFDGSQGGASASIRGQEIDTLIREVKTRMGANPTGDAASGCLQFTKIKYVGPTT